MAPVGAPALATGERNQGLVSFPDWSVYGTPLPPILLFFLVWIEMGRGALLVSLSKQPTKDSEPLKRKPPKRR